MLPSRSAAIGGYGAQPSMSGAPMQHAAAQNQSASRPYATTYPVQTLPRHPVHIIWDIEDCFVPPDVSQSFVVNRLLNLAEQDCYGFVV